jgi:hypothetical protein
LGVRDLTLKKYFLNSLFICFPNIKNSYYIHF